MQFWAKTNDMAEYILIGEKYGSKLGPALEKLGYRLVYITDNPFIDERLSGHADLSVFYDEAQNIFASKHLKSTFFADSLRNIGFFTTFLQDEQSRFYPCDAQLNICLLGDHFIFNPQTAHPPIIEHLKKQGREGIECKQGYTRCSVCVVDNNSIITADSVIADKCRKVGIDVLEIVPGYIELAGFEYGFIGGASIRLSDKFIAFTGILTAHPQYMEITDFIKSKGLNIIYLTDQPAFDIGSAYIITA